MGEKITFKRPDGKDCVGYYARPAAGDKAPGVVVIQEWWGLNDQIKGVADRLAEAGFRALVPDLYRGKVTLDAAEASHMMTDLDFKDAATQNVRGAAQYLKKDSAKVATIGFCMGGALTMLAAMYVPETDAVSSWYGVPPPEAGDPGKIRVPVQGHFALQDRTSRPRPWTRSRPGSRKVRCRTSSTATTRTTRSATRPAIITIPRRPSLPGSARSRS
jgi:carboxymethylenebutenolidase